MAYYEGDPPKMEAMGECLDWRRLIEQKCPRKEM